MPVVLVGAGVLFVASAHAGRVGGVRTLQATTLPGLVAAEQSRVAALQAQVASVRAQVDALSRQAGPTGSAVAAELDRARTLGGLVGLDPVTGPGMSVALNDAPAPPPGQPLPAGMTPDDFVVHQQDVQAVVNALWAGGATGMSVMGQRIVTTSAVQCVGNTLILDGRVYSPPYTIRAVGDPVRLAGALDGSAQVRVYREYSALIGLGYAARSVSSMTLPGYSGGLNLRYAHPAG